jgi:hypothetical protein
LAKTHTDIRNLRRAINESITHSRNESETHYFIKLKEIVDDLLSIKDFDSKSVDLLNFITKDVVFLYETCEGTANVMMYIERIACI